MGSCLSCHLQPEPELAASIPPLALKKAWDVLKITACPSVTPPTLQPLSSSPEWEVFVLRGQRCLGWPRVDVTLSSPGECPALGYSPGAGQELPGAQPWAIRIFENEADSGA